MDDYPEYDETFPEEWELIKEQQMMERIRAAQDQSVTSSE